MLVSFPLIENFIPFFGTAYRIEHIAVTLTVHTLLKSLYMQTKVHLIGRDIFTDSWQVVALQGVQEYKKAQNLIIGSPFCLIQTRIIFNILRQIDFFRYRQAMNNFWIPEGGFQYRPTD